jgi:hypothetical protein
MNNCYVYYNKNDANNKISSLNDQEFKLFCGDTLNTDNGQKTFFVTTYNYIYNAISSNEDNLHYYEYYNDQQKIKLFFDIDHKIDINCDINNESDIVLGHSLTKIEEILNEINIDINEQKYIICSAHTQNKISFHIIFPDIVFDNVVSIKNLTNKFLNNNKYIDNAVYRTGCFRCLYCSKINKNNKLIIHSYRNYNYDNYKQTFFDTLITNVNENKKVFTYHNIEKINTIDKTDNIENINDINYDKLKEYIDIINIERFNNYNEWIMFGMIFKNCNLPIDIWIEKSKTSNKFNIDECRYKWNSFNETCKQKYSVKTIYYFAKLDNQKMYYELINKQFDDNYHKKCLFETCKKCKNQFTLFEMISHKC